jgi:SAM-dependent methyltransferase
MRQHCGHSSHIAARSPFRLDHNRNGSSRGHPAAASQTGLCHTLRGMRVLLRAAFHLSSLRRSNIGRVAIVLDADTGIHVDDVVLLLRPWRAWLEIIEVLKTSIEPTADWLEAAITRGAGAISIVTDRPGFAESLIAVADQRNVPLLTSDYPIDDDRVTALFHEMSHHHFELGGVNDWAQGPSLHGAAILQQISAVNCITHFPQYAIPDLKEKRSELGRPLDALDVGCGPISRLRWGALEGLLHLSGADPLLEIYDLILAYHGLDCIPRIKVDRAIAANAEDLASHIASESLDFAYSCNALDHVENPSAVITQIGRSLRPGSLFALEFATREGSRQQWQQLHQFDLFLEPNSNKLVCQQQNHEPSPLVLEHVPLTLDRVVSATDDHTRVVLRRD